MKPRPIVGQTLYALNVGNNARHREQKLTLVTVISVGRKYFKALPEEYAKSPHMAVQYHLDDWRELSQYCANWALYASPQEWEDEKEHSRLCDDIWQASRSGRPFQGASLANLRIAHAALLPSPPPTNSTEQKAP